MQHEAIDIPESTREAWQKSVDIMADLMDIPAALILRVCDAEQTQVFVASRTQSNPYLQGDITERHPNSYFEASIAYSSLLKVVNAAHEARWRNGPAVGKGMVSYMGLPLTWPDGEAFGVICVMDNEENRYSARSERLLEQFQEIINLHLVLLFQQHELREKTKIDALTGACTRRDFFDSGSAEVKRARRYGIPLSVLLLDLDHFKDVNDRYGHACGDAVLRVLTRRIMDSLRASDKYYRFGGEEFVVLLPHSELEGAHLVAERIRVLVEAKAVEFRDLEIPVTVSIGLARLEGAGETLDELVAKADKALYMAKEKGRNRVEVYERLPELDA
ncbi:MAG: GGDEF domain-containing protein [Gammaproteobacteria bacterium]|nr:GGDEF domain-containing protein [Gammaproteobacteria bacterium]